MADEGKGGRWKSRENRPAISAQELFDRQPPYALEAEMCLLGSLILEPKIIPDALPLVRSAKDFYDDKHGHIYQAIIDLYDQRNTGDLVQLIDMLRDRKVLDLCGGVDYLETLANSVPAATNAPHFARIVGEKAKLRRLIDTAGQIIYDAYHTGELGPEGAREVLDKAEMAVFEIAQETAATDPQSLAELLELEMRRIETADFEGGGYSGVATGYYDLDEMLRGFQPGEFIIIAARPSMGKCLTADSEIVCRDGSVTTIEELCQRQSGEIPTLHDNMKLAWATPSAFINDGLKPAFEVTTRLGRRIRTTITHPFLTIDGWTPLGNLQVGAKIAVPRVLHVQGTRELPEHRIKLLAYLIGDGGLTGTTPRFTNSNPRIAADFAAAVEAFGGMTTTLSSTREGEAPSWRISRDDGATLAAREAFASALRHELARANLTQQSVAQAVGVSKATLTHWTQAQTVPDEAAFAKLCMVLNVQPAALAPDLLSARHNAPSPLTSWLSELGLMGKGSHDKCVPACIFTLPREQLALFLNRLFATDGWATALASGQSQLGYASVNERLARQVQHLLLRFGIIASLKQRWIKYRDARRCSWQLDITDATSIRTFIEEIGIFGKEPALQRVSLALAQRRPQTNRDLVPVEIWPRIEQAKGEMSWSQLARTIGASTNLHVGSRALSRTRLAKIADALHDQSLSQLASSDIYWDEIVSIEPLGMRQVYDLTIPATHNFVANDVCVHNTALAMNLAEQMAMGGLIAGQQSGKQSPVGFFSLEMSKGAIVQRLLSARSGVSGQALRGGHKIPDRDLRELIIAAEDLKHAPIYIDDSPDLTVLNLRARARRMAAQYGIKCIMIDYLQLMSAPGAARESRQVEVSTISRGVKSLARELNVPVVCLSQLNRGSENREGNRPRMSDLRESGSIEQDADVVILLHREEYYHVQNEDWKMENPDKVGIAELIIAKQRNGPTGVVKLAWDNKTTRFKSLDQHSQASGAGYDMPAAPKSSPKSNSGYSSPSQAAADFGGGPSWIQGGAQPFEANTSDAPFDVNIKPQTPGSSFANRPKTGPPTYHRDGGGSDQRPEME
ncbi:hypothetical protein LBMAG48_25280 [Phycisphaerae bacterium]|nr:hypothetical protein LBMAG48_25280 [Phycisphaerae bacterium]